MPPIRRHLAAETAPLHALVDSRAGALEADALIAFFARGFVPLEAALDRADAARLLPEWPDRRRAHLLPPHPDDAAPRLVGEAETWGALYVLEGSRLGAALLRRTSEHPFFRAERPFWGVFLDRLALADGRLGDRDGMVAGARKAFSTFL